ncbi:hypothetical protein MKX01_025425 [Papaver californicum]|nr:hypothetical protein MKX01_025425 [Papaver californicum]
MASSLFKLVLSLMILLVSTQNLSSVAVVVTSALPEPNPCVAPAPSSEPTKVSLALYYETLCPGCTDFIVNYFQKIFTSGVTDIMDLKLVPYGNAIVGENNTIICQHGPEECFLNQVEACAIHVWPDVGTSSRWSSCLEEPGFRAEPVNDCINGGERLKIYILELQYANETGALIPSHQYVPWVTVNKVPLYDDYDNFLKAVCSAYRGTPLPRVCQEPTTDIKANSTQEICYVDEASPAAKVRPPGTTWRRLMKF